MTTEQPPAGRPGPIDDEQQAATTTTVTSQAATPDVAKPAAPASGEQRPDVSESGMNVRPERPAATPAATDGGPSRPFWRKRLRPFWHGKTRSTTQPADQAPTAGTASPTAAPADADAGAPPAAEPAAAKLLASERPPGVPPDPWKAFATTPAERTPGRLRRGWRALGRALIHEYALVLYGSVLLAALMTWPTLRYPLHTIAQDTGGPARQAWQLAWAGHALITDPTQLWHGNTFFPERHSLAFFDSLLGYAPLGMLGSGVTAAVLRYNLLFVAAHALLFVGAYALVRQLGAGRTGAAVAAAAFAYPPWRLAQDGHLHIISAGGVPLALALLARGHGWSLRHGFRPRRRHAGWAAAGWLVAAWQLSLGFAIGLPFAYALGIAVLVSAVAIGVRRLRRRSAGPVLGGRLLTVDVLGLLIFAGVGVLLALPYLKVAGLHPYARATRTELDFFSPPLRSLFIGPAESRIWGAAHAVPRASLPWSPEMTLLPGFVLYALALAGLLFSVFKLRHRLLLLLGVVVTAVLSLGTGFFEGRWTYLPLFGHLPFSGVRTPGLLVMWTTLLLAVLAAGAVGEFVRRIVQMSALRVPPWPGPWLRLATFVPLVLVLIEGLNATPHPVVPAQPAAMRIVDGPLLVLPTAAAGDELVMLWSTTKFQRVANGAGFTPQRQEELRTVAASFPDVASVQYLRGLGINTVVLLRNRVAGTPWERAGDIPVDALGIRREDVADAVVFRLT